ncbi:glycosyltransferase [Methanococcus maripaludis]|uniref:Glycosyl transferase, group 1 n=1 Tax=Methanococcus maripaludis (strain DSM 14266 / JCM 13030 / NBRC 101832 / S2 / LL) TaxID=267377 RepID=Q6M0B5_METMP|nr:glycosyltransferase [Methanococcus maripaludis]CAF29912.1 Glycosyl transferase, group 1 [Methanococcus maripaludis S2]
MLKKRILVIAPHYNSFVKGQVDEISKSVEHIDLLIKYNPLTEISNYIPHKNSKHFQNFRKKNLATFKDKPSNVSVHLIPTVYFKPDGKNKKLGDMLFKKFDKYIQKNNLNFDLIHAHFTWPYGYVAMKLKEKYNKKVILTVHENRNWLIKEYESKNKKFITTWKNSDVIIRVNKKDIPLLKRYNENTVNIPNGYDEIIFKKIENIDKIKEDLNIPKNKKIILNVANYVIPHKNQLNLVKAVYELQKKRKDFILYLIGNYTGDEKKIINLIDELNLKDVVKVLGPKPHDEIPLWMNVADLFVFPSYSESFGVVNIEALACATPVISTINGGSEEIITSEEYGFIYTNPEDYEKLAELIDKGLNKKWDSAKILEYSKEFTWENISEEILNLYSTDI